MRDLWVLFAKLEQGFLAVHLPIVASLFCCAYKTLTLFAPSFLHINVVIISRIIERFCIA